MERLTDEQLAAIRERAEAAKEVPFYTWEASELIEQDVPKLLAEVERLRRENKLLRSGLRNSVIRAVGIESEEEFDRLLAQVMEEIRYERKGDSLGANL